MYYLKRLICVIVLLVSSPIACAHHDLQQWIQDLSQLASQLNLPIALASDGQGVVVFIDAATLQQQQEIDSMLITDYPVVNYEEVYSFTYGTPSSNDTLIMSFNNEVIQEANNLLIDIPTLEELFRQGGTYDYLNKFVNTSISRTETLDSSSSNLVKRDYPIARGSFYLDIGCSVELIFAKTTYKTGRLSYGKV